jgi:hypothetical protein
MRPSEELGTGDRKLEKDAEGRGRSRGGKGGIYGGREKQRGLCTRAFPDRAAAKLGGANTTIIIIAVVSIETIIITYPTILVNKV